MSGGIQALLIICGTIICLGVIGTISNDKK